MSQRAESFTLSNKEELSLFSLNSANSDVVGPSLLE